MKPKLISGGNYTDERGRLDFINDFDLTPVKRLYCTQNSTIDIIRAWQGHKIESRWFFCNQGSFKVKLIAINNWNKPSKNCLQLEYQLEASQPEVLFIPPGYANGFQALEKNSKLIIMSDYKIEEIEDDNYRFDLNTFTW